MYPNLLKRVSLNKTYVYPYIMITFHAKDLPLFQKLVEVLGVGFITKVKGANAFRYTVRGLAGVVLILGLINGKFRTPKIHTLHGLIVWLNNHEDYNLPLLPIDGSDLGSNAWLAGFCDADVHFIFGTG